MADLDDFLSAFYKGVPAGTSTPLIRPIFSGSTVDAANPLDAARLGLGLGNGESKGGFGGSGKSFSELSGGTGWGGILGLLGITAANVAGQPDTAQTIVDAGPQGVENAITVNGGNMIEGIEGTFARIAIIVLGFIFVAVGLSMFKPGTIVQAAKDAVV